MFINYAANQIRQVRFATYLGQLTTIAQPARRVDDVGCLACLRPSSIDTLLSPYAVLHTYASRP